MMLNGIQIPESLNKLPEDSIPNNTQIGITANIRRIVARYGVDDDEWAEAISSQYFLLCLSNKLKQKNEDYENLLNKGLIVTSNYFVAENGVTRRSRRFSAFIGCLCDNRLGNNGNIHIVHKVEKNLHFLLALAAGLVRGIDNDLLDILVHDGLCQFLHIHIFLCQGDKGIQTVIHFFPLFHPFFDNFNFEL